MAADRRAAAGGPPARRGIGVLRALSLDVVAGGLSGGALAVWATGARMPLAWWGVLALSIWTIYTVDHLLDAGRLGVRGADHRYRFHQVHARPLRATVLVTGTLAAAAAVAWLPGRVLLGGLALGLLSGAHLAGAQLPCRRWIPKELSVAGIYTGGIWMGPLLLAGQVRPWAWLAALLHGTAVLLNLGMYAVIEERRDAVDDSASISRTMGGERVRRVVLWLTLLAAAGAVVGAAWGPTAYEGAWAALLLLIGTPALILAAPSRFLPAERYRLCGELVFLLLAVPCLFRP